MFNELVVAYFEVLYRDLPGSTEEKHEKTPGIFDIPSEIPMLRLIHMNSRIDIMQVSADHTLGTPYWMV
jgi:hypothetical protein